MKYTYRDERVIRDKTDVMCFVRLGIWVCVTLAVFLADGYLIFIKGTDSIGSPVLGGMLCVVVVVMAVSIRRDIQKRRVRALQTRRTAMEQGVRYDGQIVDAGTEIESEWYEYTDDDNTTKRRSFTLPNHWMEVAYLDPQSGEEKRFRAVHFSKRMERFIGCGVDVYVWHEWSEFVDKDLALTYIDTYGLG